MSAQSSEHAGIEQECRRLGFHGPVEIASRRDQRDPSSATPGTLYTSAMGDSLAQLLERLGITSAG